MTNAVAASPPVNVLAQLQRVSFRYPGSSADLLTDVDFTLRAGELTVLAGANGYGKTTLVQLLCGQLKPTRGTVRVFGADPARVDRLPEVGLVTEPFHPTQSPLPVDLTGQELVDWLRVLDGVTPGEADRLRESLQLGVALWQRPIRQLSKGERQRTLLLAVLARRPRLVLADEPQEGLDPLSRALIAETLREQAGSGCVGVLWISHHLSETLSYADRYVELTGGRLVEHTRRTYRITIRSDGSPARSIESCSLHGLAALVESALTAGTSALVEIHAAGDAE